MKIVLAALVFSLSSTVMADGAKEAINAAKKARNEASAVGFEWRDMGKMIKKAETAEKSGKGEKAIQLANRVIMQSKQALKQAQLAKTAGPHF